MSTNDLVRVTWSDLGSPRRVMEVLAELESRPVGVGAGGGANQVEAGSGASRERSTLSSARIAGSTGIF